MRGRLSWGWVAFVVVVVIAIALWFTGRLDLHWRPATKTAAKDDGHDKEKEGESHAEEEGRVKGDKAVLDSDAVKAGGLRSEPVRSGSVAVLLETTGEIQAPDGRIAHVTPRVSGVVREIARARGDSVAAGAALATIESADLGEARAAYDAAVADLAVAERNVEAWRHQVQGSAAPSGGSGWVDLDQALGERAAAVTERDVVERTFNRTKELEARGLRSRTELLAAEADLIKARSRADAAERRLPVLGTVADTELTRARQRADAARAKLQAFGGDAGARGDRATTVVLRSPIAGVVTARDLTVGQTVEATAKVFSVADLSEIWVVAALYDRDLAAVRQGQPATIRVQGLGDAVFKGKVIQVGPGIDEKTRTLPVRIAVRNPASANGLALRPGMFATVALETSRKPGALLIPTAAVQSLDGQPLVVVETLLSAGAADHRRPVKLGSRDQEAVEVVEGLSAGELVVVANAYLLKSEFERSKISHGH
jgi:cobalt-zinc-cadmium efflux system membrane fusion protein